MSSLGEGNEKSSTCSFNDMHKSPIRETPENGERYTMSVSDAIDSVSVNCNSRWVNSDSKDVIEVTWE